MSAHHPLETALTIPWNTQRARLTALIMARGYRDEDIVVTLLRHTFLPPSV
jgi:hypothetical protein